MYSSCFIFKCKIFAQIKFVLQSSFERRNYEQRNTVNCISNLKKPFLCLLPSNVFLLNVISLSKACFLGFYKSSGTENNRLQSLGMLEWIQLFPRQEVNETRLHSLLIFVR